MMRLKAVVVPVAAPHIARVVDDHTFLNPTDMSLILTRGIHPTMLGITLTHIGGLLALLPLPTR